MSFTESETRCVLATSRSLLAPGNAASSLLADALTTSPLSKTISVVETRKRHVATIRNQMRGTRGGIHSHMSRFHARRDPTSTRARLSVIYVTLQETTRSYLRVLSRACTNESHMAEGRVEGINSAETRDNYTRRHGPLPKRLWRYSSGPTGGSCSLTPQSTCRTAGPTQDRAWDMGLMTRCAQWGPATCMCVTSSAERSLPTSNARLIVQ
jgi:hypothetical protein